MLDIEKFKSDGYVILDCEQDNLIDIINLKYIDILNSGAYETNSKIYSYNEKPRVVDAYKLIPEIAEFAHNPKLIKFLKDFYKSEPMAFSNILFGYGSEQPLHSDYIHHGTIPELFLCGAWTALEDIQDGTGELCIVPKSHNLDIFRYAEHGLKKPKSLPEIKKNYAYYEGWVKELTKKNKLKKETVRLKKGQTIIWQANLLHGGSAIQNPEMTRRSFVVHYVFNGASKFYNPTFSFFNGRDDYFLREFNYF